MYDSSFFCFSGFPRQSTQQRILHPYYLDKTEDSLFKKNFFRSYLFKYIFSNLLKYLKPSIYKYASEGEMFQKIKFISGSSGKCVPAGEEGIPST